MSMRKSISKRSRFEVFKRDLFTCQYCGSHPPDVVLEVDHIEAVANGGTDDQDNLVTSCFNCNRGKSDVPLELIPQSLSDKATDIAEREAQIRGYQSIMQERRERIEEEAWKIAKVLISKNVNGQYTIHKEWFVSIKRFISKLGYDEVYGAAELADARKPYSEYTKFMYFCGICWNKIKGQKNG